MILCENLLSSGDWIAVGGVIVSIFLGTYVVNNQTKNRVQKDFFIKEIDALKSDYIDFFKDILSDRLSASEIRDGFNLFSHKIDTLNTILKSEYKLVRNNVFESHSNAQIDITEFKSIEEQYEKKSVVLTDEEKNKVDKHANDINKSMIELVITLNRAPSIEVWKRQDFYNN